MPPREGHIYLTFDAVDAMGRLSDMQSNLREFAHTDIHGELVDWQTEDMHRKYPNIDSEQEYVSWFTLIWPRSRTYDQTHGKHGRVLRRASRRRSRAPSLATTPRLTRGPKRPILRDALFNRLVQRMTELLGERLSWTRTGKGAEATALASLGPQSARRAAMLAPSTATAAPAPSAASLGPRTRQRLVALGASRAVATPAPASSLGPRTRERIAKLKTPPATPAPAPSPASLGPHTRSRLMKLGLLKPE